MSSMPHVDIKCLHNSRGRKKYIISPTPYAILFFTMSVISVRAIADTNEPTGKKWYFDQTALVGSAFGAQVNNYNKKAINAEHDVKEGTNNVDVSLNDALITQGHQIVFSKNQQGEVQPCLDRDLLNLLQIKNDKLKPLDNTQACVLFDDLFVEHGANWRYDSQNLALHLIIPQSFLIRNPRGFISEKDWDTGITALWLQHNSDYSHVKNTTAEYDYFWSSINAGINFGSWQLRNQSYMRYLKYDDKKGDFNWENNRTWLSRKFGSIESELSLGNAYTDANVFDSMAFTGVKLATDKRMWPQSLIGYAPTIRGVAKTTSQVIVKQNNQTIYQITVPPGPFVINDLPDTNNRGDINVDVVSSDGVIDSFLVPYSHLASSMRPGSYAYSASLGEVRDFSDTNARFAEATLQAGLTNRLTTNSGIRLADDYVALLLGNVWGTPFGAVELNTTWSMAQLPDQKRLQGWRAEASYSKVFKSGTNLMLAAYRFSTQDFRDLQDVLGQREALAQNTSYSSYTLQQRNRVSVSLNQSLGKFGNVALSASTADYYDNKSKQTQFQLNYSKSWQGITFNVGATRQLSTYVTKYTYLDNYSLSDSTSSTKTNETNYFASVTFPLDWKSFHSNVSSSVTKSKNNTNMNLGLSGVTGENSSVSWSVNASQNDYSGTDNAFRNSYFTGTLQENTRVGAWRLMYSQDNDNNKQYGAGLSGSILLHSDGITLGPWSSGTLALIEAKGAKGATVENGQGAMIDYNGYALLSNLSPYRYNYVSLNTSNMTLNTELKNTSQRVVPYGDAFVKVKFETVQGHAALISGKTTDGQTIPMGSSITDQAGKSLGMVGQGGQFYVRLNQAQGKLQVQISDTQSCQIPYKLSKSEMNQPISQLDLTCVTEN